MARWRDAFEAHVVSGYHLFEFWQIGTAAWQYKLYCGRAKAAETMIMAFDIAGVAVSAGAACSSGKVQSSHVLEAMGAGDEASHAIRVSGGWATKKADFKQLQKCLCAYTSNSLKAMLLAVFLLALQFCGCARELTTNLR